MDVVDVLGWTLVAVGAALYVTALVRTLRANPSTTLPYFGPPPIVPAGAIAMRLGGTALLIVGAVVLVPFIGLPAILVVVAGPLVAAGATSLHNARVASRR